MKLQTERKNESGAIMLEIIAVLALMGVMGAMLFRQINQRNQELHNIQMASEIRLAKEAFSAWLQTNQASLTRDCLQGVERCSNGVVKCAYNSATLANDVANYLPDGYLVGANALSVNYDLYVYGYWIGQTGSCSPAFYGAVVPKNNVLPDSGQDESSWNFKRAARIAMLVGGDGGAYDPDITGTDVVGSVGSWRIPISQAANDSGIPVNPNNIARYVALTGLDVFQPEVEVPAGEINVPQDMVWAGSAMGAWNAFVVGGQIGQQGCFEINHDTQTGKMVNPDIIRQPTDNVAVQCDPVFWVDATGANANQGAVYVRNGMEVGYDKNTKTSSIELNGGPGSNGEIVVNDQYGNTSVIISGSGDNNRPNATLTFENGKILTNRSTGNIKDGGQGHGYQYQLDPANTSVMYDIRLGARGGIKLSELLPSHILQDIGQIDCNSTARQIQAPSCKDGYKKALVLIPSVSPTNLRAVSRSDKANDAQWDAESGIEVLGLNEDPANSNIKSETLKKSDDSPITLNYAEVNDSSKKKLSVQPAQIYINTTVGGHRVSSHGFGRDSGASRETLSDIAAENSTHWNVVCSGGSGVIGYQTYCMLDSSAIKNANVTANVQGQDVSEMDMNTCTAKGMKWNTNNGGYCETVTAVNTCATFTAETSCKRAGCLWNAEGACVNATSNP